MKMRKKGKVHPSSSTSPATTLAGDTLSVLNLLPAAIFTLTIVLSLEDREVLAYMITRSMKSTNVNKKKTLNSHKSPVFDCECFECYTSFWEKWDCSPNRELIHQAIEAFEETLSNGEMVKRRNKKKEKVGHRGLAGKSGGKSPEDDVAVVVDVVEVKDEGNGDDPDDGSGGEGGDTVVVVEEGLPEMAAAAVVAVGSQHKGLARKMLPDVIGLLNWRLWSLWSPN